MKVLSGLGVQAVSQKRLEVNDAFTPSLKTSLSAWPPALRTHDINDNAGFECHPSLLVILTGVTGLCNTK